MHVHIDVYWLDYYLLGVHIGIDVYCFDYDCSGTAYYIWSPFLLSQISINNVVL